MKDFATKDKPIRASSLYKVLQCPGRVVFDDREVGSAAETGSLVHLGVVKFHESKSLDKALQEMRDQQSLYPKSDYAEAEKHLTPYTQDPRNIDAEIVIAEKEVTFSISQDVEDKNGPIYIKGHLDQVRRENGKLYVWDIKTGKRFSGWEMLHVATVQLCSYTIGACQLLNVPVYTGGIISTYGYRRRGADKPENSPGGVFFNAPWELGDCGEILRPLVKRVKEIREDDLYIVPGEHCSSCIGIDECLPKLREYNAISRLAK
jgi:hypothetical protein